MQEKDEISLINPYYMKIICALKNHPVYDKCDNVHYINAFQREILNETYNIHQTCTTRDYV